MERRSIADLAEHGHDNIVHTYLGLGQVARGATIVVEPAYTLCASPVELAYCNFAIDVNFHADPVDPHRAAARLASHALDRAAFRVFSFPGRELADSSSALKKAGFAHQHRLVQLGSTGQTATPKIQLERCDLPAERLTVAEFMATQFSWQRECNVRSEIVRATSGCPHELYRYVDQDTLIGSVMITHTPDSVGIYNLAVDKRHRRRGIGGEILTWCLELAARLGKSTVLQCDSGLAGWYKSRGLLEIGLLDAWSLQ